MVTLAASKLINLANQVRYTLWSATMRRDLLKPTYTVDNFSQISLPSAIKCIVLDKDNCFAKPHSSSVWPQFKGRWDELMAANGKTYDVYVLSNTAGDFNADPDDSLALTLEGKLGVRVIRHRQKKPMCYTELPELLPGVDPKSILVVGDRLVTDILMANLIGAQSCWIRGGVHPSIFNRLELWLI